MRSVAAYAGLVIYTNPRLRGLASTWGLGAAVFVCSWMSATGRLGVPAFWPAPAVVALAAAAGLAAGLVRVRHWPLYAVAALSWIAGAAWPALVVASYHAGATLRRRGHLWAYLLGAAVVMGASVPVSAAIGGRRYLATGVPGNFLVMCLVLVGLPLIAGMWGQARRAALTALRDRADQLEREQQAQTERARAEERNRIAREMHDIVAHRVSLMVLHAGALEVNTTDARTAEAAAVIRQTGREALTNLRDVLGVLRSTRPTEPTLAPQPTIGELNRLLDQSRAAGLRITRRDEGAPRPLPAGLERAAYRVVQEALTNVHKHAGDGATEVILRYLPDSVEVRVRNDPPTTAAPPATVISLPTATFPATATAGAAAAPAGLPGARIGLVGLRERVELLDGTLAAGEDPDGGFTVLARIPDTRHGESP